MPGWVAKGSIQHLCLPRLRPSGPRNILHSSICPNGENMTRISFSLHFLEIIPINNFLSSTAKELKDKEYYQQDLRSSSLTAVISLVFRIWAYQNQIPSNVLCLQFMKIHMRYFNEPDRCLFYDFMFMIY